MILLLLGQVYTRERGHAWKRTEMCGDRYKYRKMISLMIYIYSCIYRLDG